ncbi:MAG TPA: hypothetical protein VMG30_15565 [Acidobacteriota bacterium]|nr:hypothetical protein [Acidobacteriota bacterium]
MRSLLIDSQKPETVYLGTSSGRIFKSSDAGRSWVSLSPGIGPFRYVIDKLVQHPTELNHIYAAAWDLHSNGGGLFESMDAGLTWARVMLPQPVTAVRSLAFCKSLPSHMIVGTLSGPYVSTDGGKSWKRVGGIDVEKAHSVAIDPNNSKILYVGTWRLAYKSVDFGKTWVCLADRGMVLDSDVMSFSINSKNPDEIYSSACSGVYRSTNGLQTFTRMRLLSDHFAIRTYAVYIDPVDTKIVYAGTVGGLWVSKNSGQNWTRLTPADITVNTIQVDPRNNQRILIGTEYQGAMLSEDGGQSWKESNQGFIHKQVSWIMPDSKSAGGFVAGVQSGSGGIYQFSSQGQTWKPSQVAPQTRVSSFLILPGDRGRLAGTVEGLYFRAERENDWKKLEGPIAKRTIYSLELDPAQPFVYAGTDKGIYRASLKDLGFRAPTGADLNSKVWSLAASKDSPEFVYAGTSLGLLRSSDKGITWSVVSSKGLPLGSTIEALAISPSNREHLIAGTSVGLFESQDGGVLWEKAPSEGLDGHVTSVLFLDNLGKRILAADKLSSAILYSRDGGQSWDKINAPQFESPIFCLAKDPQLSSRVFVGTQSDGIFMIDFP